MRLSNLVKLSLLSLLLLVFIPGAQALNNLYTVPSDPGASCWAAGTGSFFDNTYYISLTRPETDVYAGLVFQGLNISRNDPISSATLRLYFDIEFTPGVSSASIYGYNDPLGPGFFTSGSQLRSAPKTSHRLNANLSGIASPGWQEFDVTSIVQEIVNRPFWYANDNLGLVILGAEGQVHRTITSNIALPAQWAQLNITWAEAAGTQYRGYTIINQTLTAGTPFTGLIKDPGAVSQTLDIWVLPQNESARSTAWVKYDTPIVEQGNTMTNTYTKGVVYNGYLYIYGLDDDLSFSTHIYRAPLDNLTDWSKMIELQAVVDSQDWFSMTWLAQNTSILTVTAETGFLTFQKVNVSDWTTSTEVHPITGFGSGAQAGAAVLVDTNGVIYIAGGIPGPSDSTTKVAYGYSLDGGQTFTSARATGSGVYSGYPYLFQLYNYVFMVYELNSPLSAVYRYIDINNLGAGWSSQFTLYTVSNLGYTSCYVQPNYFNNPNPYRDVIVFTAQRTGASETRLGAPYLYLNSSGLPDVYSPGGYNSLGNQTGVDKVFNSEVWVGEDLYSIYMDYGTPYNQYWANPAYSQNVSFTFYNTNPTPALNIYPAFTQNGYGMADIIIPTEEFLPGGYNVTVYDENGTLVNTTCIQQATTLEDIEKCIDNLLGGSDPLEPNPPGSDPETETLARANLTLYMLILGLGFVILPPAWMAHTRRFETLPIVGFLIFIGLGLLWSIRYL